MRTCMNAKCVAFGHIVFFGCHSLPTMPVGLAKNTAGQRNPFFKQTRAGTTIDELKTPAPPYLPISSFHRSAWSRMNSPII